MPARTRRKIVFIPDAEPDFSWLEQDQYNPNKPGYDPIYRTAADMRAKRDPIDPEWYRDPDNHVALAMLVYELTAHDDDWQLIDSLGNIDFLDDDSDDHGTGTFYSVQAIPKRWTYLRTLAREAKLPRTSRTRRKLRAGARSCTSQAGAK